jgi:hypothetical protein
MGRSHRVIQAGFRQRISAAATDVIAFAKDTGGLDILQRMQASSTASKRWICRLRIGKGFVGKPRFRLAAAAGNIWSRKALRKIIIVSSVLGAQGGLMVPAHTASNTSRPSRAPCVTNGHPTAST